MMQKCLLINIHLLTDNEGGRPSTENVVCGTGPPPKQSSPTRRREKLLHVRARQLQRRRASVMVPPPPVHRAPPAIIFHSRDSRDNGGLRSGGRGREVCHAALPLHLRERQGEAQRTVLLPRVADLGCGGHPACLAAVPAPAYA